MHDSEQILARVQAMLDIAHSLLNDEHLNGPGTAKAAMLKADLSALASTLAWSLRNEHGKKYHDTTGS